MNHNFQQLPIFIPRVDKNISSYGIQLPAVMVYAPHVEWRPKVPDQLREVTSCLIIDPSTHRVMYKNARENKNYSALPFSSIEEPEQLYSDARLRQDEFVAKAIQYQHEKQADIIIAPYLFSHDTDEVKFGLNITMIPESIQYMETNAINKPLYCMIPIGLECLTRITTINYIVDRYTDFFKDKVDGYFVMVDGLDCEKADMNQLFGLSKLVFQLSAVKPTFVSPIGPFGEVLCSLGAAGFVSGVGISETLDIKLLEATRRSYAPQVNRIYIPEIFDYINDVEAEKVGYTCECPACSGSFARDGAAKELHFLIRRQSVMQELSNRPQDEKVEYMLSKLNDGIRLANSWVADYAASLKTGHLTTWRGVLETAQQWKKNDSDDSELEALLNDLEGGE